MTRIRRVTIHSAFRRPHDDTLLRRLQAGGRLADQHRMARGIPVWVMASLLTLVACDMVLTLDASQGSGQQDEEGLISLASGEATRIYYQYVDEKGAVHFVESLDAVPEAWRDRVGFVEMSSPPPMSPADMQRAIQADHKRVAARMKANTAATGPEVVIYAADWCGACRKAKAYMDRKGIRYQERNVDQPGPRKELLEKSGGRSIPVIEVNGRIMKGFNPQRLEQMISEAS
jgi:glutaredoxin